MWFRVQGHGPYLWIFQNPVPFLGCPYHKDYSIFGSVLGYPDLGELLPLAHKASALSVSCKCSENGQKAIQMVNEASILDVLGVRLK